jgi:hypothetical protein
MTPYLNPLHGVQATALDAAWSRLAPALAALAIELTAHDQPPPSVRSILALPYAEAAEKTIALVRTVFQLRISSGALTQAAKRAGNAARGVRRALAYDEARRVRQALAAPHLPALT